MSQIGPGSRIGAYEVISSLGMGGMGEVYRARDFRLNRDVAIKFFLRHSPPTAIVSNVFAEKRKRLQR